MEGWTSSLFGFALSVHPDKITRYLLDSQHQIGGPKATYFIRFGFDPGRPDELADALVMQAWDAPQIDCKPHPGGFDMTITATGPIAAPDGRSPIVTSVWNWNPEDLIAVPNGTPLNWAKLVTAIPRPTLTIAK